MTQAKSSILIGIDGNEANVARRVGSNVYAYKVIESLYQLDKRGRYDWRVYLKKPPLPDMPSQKTNWQYQVFGPQLLWTRWRLPLRLALERIKPAVFFSPGHYVPWRCPVPLVMTVMDLAFLRHPKDYRPQDLKKLELWTAHSVKQATQVLAISQATKRDIVSFYHVYPRKVTVTYPGYDTDRFKPDVSPKKAKNILSRYGIKGKYLIYVGTLQPRKNIRRLLRAFAYIASRYPKLSLVLVGKKGWLYQDIFRSAQALGMNDRLIFTGYVPNSELPFLIKPAQAYVLPSLFEGFGIPVVEAMACGVPVVVSRVSSLPELAGPAGLYIKNPKSVTQIAEALVKVLELPQEERRRRITLGYQQVRQFSWQACGRKTLAVLEAVARQ